MASRNQIKNYREGFVYHLYNRGVEKRIIFVDDSDYKFFLSKMRGFLLPCKGHKDHRDNITLLAYCLLPNHFHLVAVNKSLRGIEYFFRSLATSYSIYFNKKYGRVGPLFQGSYKASLVSGGGLMLQKMEYVHRNPYKHGLVSLKELLCYPYSNYPNYVYEKSVGWFDIQRVLDYFPTGGVGYRTFIESSGGRDA
jgi:putative transposase